MNEDLLAGNFGFSKLTYHGEIFINNTRVIFSDKCLHFLGSTISVRYGKLALLELLINLMFILYPDDENLISSTEDQSRYIHILLATKFKLKTVDYANCSINDLLNKVDFTLKNSGKWNFIFPPKSKRRRQFI